MCVQTGQTHTLILVGTSKNSKIRGVSKYTKFTLVNKDFIFVKQRQILHF